MAYAIGLSLLSAIFYFRALSVYSGARVHSVSVTLVNGGAGPKPCCIPIHAPTPFYGVLGTPPPPTYYSIFVLGGHTVRERGIIFFGAEMLRPDLKHCAV